MHENAATITWIADARSLAVVLLNARALLDDTEVGGTKGVLRTRSDWRVFPGIVDIVTTCIGDHVAGVVGVDVHDCRALASCCLF